MKIDLKVDWKLAWFPGKGIRLMRSSFRNIASSTSSDEQTRRLSGTDDVESIRSSIVEIQLTVGWLSSISGERLNEGLLCAAQQLR